MYTDKNYKTKKELIADVKAGKEVTVYQPGGIFESQKDGSCTIEGPHFPAPHTWYASATIANGIIIKISKEKMMKVVDAILTKEQKAAGLYLEEDDHNLYLMKQGEQAPLAVFNSATVLVAEVADQAQQHLEWLKSGVTFEEA